MNNRYIYKAKRKDNGEWVEGVAIFADNKAFILNNAKVEFIKGFNENRLNFVLVEVIPETVCRCTELKDKNGKWIFEGDILKQKTTKEFAKFNSFKWELYGIVTFGNYDYNQGEAGYCSVGWYIAPLKSIAIYPKDYLVGDIQPGLNQEDILRSIYPMEVIGNIHDNPDLLEAER